MIFGSVCSGIEAASAAFHPIGWKSAWYAEIEPFPCVVLNHHFGCGRPMHMPAETLPSTIKAVQLIHDRRVDAPPNIGDMTRAPEMIRSRQISAPDVLIGGTPCQSFSIAGLRQSLKDNRGQLTLSYVETLNAIDDVRRSEGKPECIAIWENVPGALSTEDNAFGCFLGALAGNDEAVEPCDKPASGVSGVYWRWKKTTRKHIPVWPRSGAVAGPERAIAWRVLDAQYFGVAQRRARIIVVATARKGVDPSEILFEFEGVRRDTPPSREAGEGVAKDAICRAESGSHWDDELNPHPSLTQSHNTGGVGGSNQEIFSQRGAYLVNGCPEISPALKARDYKGPSSDGDSDGAPLIVHAYDTRNGLAPHGNMNGDVISPTLRAKEHEPPLVTHALRGEGFDASEDGTGRGTPIIAFSCKDYGNGAADNISPTLRSMSHDGSHQNGGGQMAIAIPIHDKATRHKGGGGTRKDDGSANGLGIGKQGDPSPTITSGDKYAVAFAQNQLGEVRAGDVFNTLNTNSNASGRNTPLMQCGMQVRRLTPRECERLQSFEDDWTLVPLPLKPRQTRVRWAADGPRYKAIGNSMCVNKIRWLGERIQMMEELKK